MNNEVKKGGTGTLIKIAFRNIGRNKRRTLFCLCAVGIAVFFMPIYQSLIDGMIKAIDEVVTTFQTGHVSVVTKQFEAEKEYMPVQYPVADGKNWREIAADIETIPGVTSVLPRIQTMATLQEGAIKHVTLWGIDIERETLPPEQGGSHYLNMAARTDGLVFCKPNCDLDQIPKKSFVSRVLYKIKNLFTNVEEQQIDVPKHIHLCRSDCVLDHNHKINRWPANANECAVGVVFENKTGKTIGDSVSLKTISSQFSDRYWSPQITGVFSFDYIKFDESTVIVEHERLQRLLALAEGTQGLFIFAEDGEKSSEITASVQRMMGSDHVVSNWKDEYWVSVMKAAEPMYFMIFLIFIVVASFLIVNTVTMIIHERIKEIGMMGALGMSKGEIVKVFFFESVILAIMGSAIGVFMGGVLIGALQNSPINFGAMYGDTFADMPLTNTIFFVFSIKGLVQAFLMGIIVASIFTLFPSLKSARVEPVEALRR